MTRWADVDVFLWEASIGGDSFGASMATWAGPKGTKRLLRTLKSAAKISVGSLVPHRHINRGQWYPYLHAQGLAKWGKGSMWTSLPRKRFDWHSVFPTIHSGAPHFAAQTIPGRAVGNCDNRRQASSRREPPNCRQAQ